MGDNNPNISKVQYSLYDYQADAVNNITKIYTSEGPHDRFAGVVLPTGGGKSFVAIQELLSSTFDENGEFRLRTSQEIASLDRNGVLNSSPLLYVAPNREILSQIKLHIVKNVLFGIPQLSEMTVDEIDALVKADFPQLNFPGLNAQTDKGNDELVTNESSRSEKVQAILRHITPDQVDMLINNAFPGLRLKCYAGMKDKSSALEDELTESDLETENALIILDEAHRVGAETWKVYIRDLIEKNAKAKILAITATPERTDRDKNDMMHDIAEMVYPGEDILSDEYIAKEIIVLDAMRDGIVTTPRLIGYDAALAESEEYKEIRDKYETTTVQKEKRELKKILDEMDALIGFKPPYIKPRETWNKTEEEKQAEDTRIAEVLRDNPVNLNGKYIAFIPSNTGEKDENATSGEITREYFEQWKARIEKQFKEAYGIVPEISFVTSNTQVQTARENSDVLKEFDDASNETGGVKVLIAIDKLNEGVHVDGIDGSFMFRPIGESSSTLFLQQSGRCISSMSKSITTAEQLLEEPRKQIFDFSGNAFKQINNNIGGRVSRKYDLEKITELQTIIQKYNGVPDPNSSNLEEARAAIALRRIAIKYEPYSDGDIPVTLGEKDKIKEIVRIATEMKLWEMEIPERTTEPLEAELTGSDFLSYTDSQRKFMELYNEAKSVSKKRAVETDIRVKKLVNVLKVLISRKPDIELPGGISLKETSKTAKGTKNPTLQPMSLDELLKQNFDPQEIEKILIAFEDMDRVGAESRRELYHRGEQYDIGEELAFVRGQLYTSQQTYEKTGVESVFEQYTTHELVKLGIIDARHPERLQSDLEAVFGIKELTDEKGFIKLEFPKSTNGFGMIESIAGRQLETGDKYLYGYDIDGFDKDGYDVFGFDRRGFNKDKTAHKVTGTRYDDRGFKWDSKSEKWIHLKTKTEYDPLGYNIDGFDENGFERAEGPQNPKLGIPYYPLPKWHRKVGNQYEILGRKVEPESKLDCHGFRYSNGVVWGYYGNIGEISTHNRFWSNGATEQKPASIDDFYSYENLDMDGYDKVGFKVVPIEVKGSRKLIRIHRDTSMEYDRNGQVESLDRYGNVIVGDDGKPVLRNHASIDTTLSTLKLLVESGKSIEEVYAIYAKSKKCSLEEAQVMLGNSLNKFVEITRIAPAVLENSELKKYLSNPQQSKQRKEQIHKFFEMVPRFSERIKNETSENLRRIECLKERERQLSEYGAQAMQKQDMKEAIRIKKEIIQLGKEQDGLRKRNAELKEYDDPYDR